MSKKYRQKQVQSLALPASVGAAGPVVGAILFFVAMGLSTGNSAKSVAMLCMVLAVVCGVVGFARLRERFRLPMLMLALVTLMGGISTAYAVAGKFALYEFLKVVTAFALTVILLSLVRGEASAPGRYIATVLEGGAALAGLASIDLISTRLISGAVQGFFGLFTSDYQKLSGVEAGIRMTSIFANPNIFAGCAGIGVLLSLGLVLSSEKEKQRLAHTVCLFINSLSFVLAFSMGASAMIAVAFLAYLALEFKSRRAALFVLMVETLVVTIAATALVAMTSLDAWSGLQPVPLLCAVVGAAVLCLLDKYVGRRVAGKLAARGKVLLIIIAVALVALVALGLVASNLTGGVDLDAGEKLRRAAYPEAGEYVLTVQASGPVSVRVESQNRQDTMMHTSTVIYRGEVSGACFTVPEDSLVVYFNFSAGEDVHVEKVVYEGSGGSGEIPLDYKLLPGFIANRLQGLRANQNAIQRLVFFEDGMKLFARSPVVGLGLGAFENGVLGVQSFFYETKYAHNHYIQLLAENGVIGLVLFVLLLVVSAAAVLLTRKKGEEEGHPLTPALGAALVFMAGHAAVEVVFSAHAYLPLAFGVFALISLCCGEVFDLPVFNTKVRTGCLAGCAAGLAVFGVLLYGNISAYNLVRTQPTFDNMAKAVSKDKFEWADYALSYVVNAGNHPEEYEVAAKADEYALRLAQQDSNTIPIYLAEYYFKTGRSEQAFAMVEKYVNYVSSDNEAWQKAFNLLMVYMEDSEEYRAGVLRIIDLMETWNEENMGSIVLEGWSADFVSRMKGN